MLENVVYLFNLISNFMYYLVNVSYFTGKCIVVLGSSIGTLILNIGSSLKSLSIVIYEDSSYFWTDILDFFVALGTTINNGFKGIIDGIVHGGQRTGETISNIVNGGWFKISSITTQFFNIIGWILLAIKKFLVTLGDGAWFLVMLIPNFLQWILDILLMIGNELRLSLLRITMAFYHALREFLSSVLNYFLDVPLHCILGLLVLYFAFKYRRLVSACLWLFTVWFMGVLWRAFSLLSRLVPRRSQRINRIPIGREVPIFEPQEQESTTIMTTQPRGPTPRKSIRVMNKKDSPTSTFCVVCLDRKKTILVMPCKHLCLCQQCANELERYQNVCPLCRNEFSNLVLVYT